MPSGPCTAVVTPDCRSQPEKSAEACTRETQRERPLPLYLAIDRRYEEREEHKTNNEEETEDHNLPRLSGSP